MTIRKLKKVNDNLTKEQGQRHKRFFKDPGIFVISTTEFTKFGLNKFTEVHCLMAYETNDRLMAICEIGERRFHVPAGKLSPRDYSPDHVSDIENVQFNYLHSEIDRIKKLTNRDYVLISTPHGTFEVVAVVKSTQKGRMPKCDFHLILRNDDWYFISHKGKYHQQFGGISHENGHIVEEFVSQIMLNGYTGAVKGEPAFGKWLSLYKEDEARLLYQSFFGVQWGSKEYGLNNVHLILHGNVILKPIMDNAFELTADCSVIPNLPNQEELINEKLGPFFMVASWRADRDTKGLKNTRIQVSGRHHRNPATLNYLI